MAFSIPVLQPGTGPVRAAHYLPATADSVMWGRLPCARDEPVLTVDPGDEVTIDTVSHEGILEDQGRDPLAFFAGHGVDAEQVLDDAVALARTFGQRDPPARAAIAAYPVPVVQSVSAPSAGSRDSSGSSAAKTLTAPG